MMVKCCENCKHADRYCICVVCEENDTVVCNIKGKHTLKADVCEKFEQIDEVQDV